jgi:hypothetical protein
VEVGGAAEPADAGVAVEAGRAAAAALVVVGIQAGMVVEGLAVVNVRPPVANVRPPVVMAETARLPAPRHHRQLQHRLEVYTHTCSNVYQLGDLGDMLVDRLPCKNEDEINRAYRGEGGGGGPKVTRLTIGRRLTTGTRVGRTANANKAFHCPSLSQKQRLPAVFGSS